MRADNRGEGGILALMSLIGANACSRGLRLLTGMGLLGAALIYGDGVITPAISVLSALEGVNVATAAFKPYVMPMAVLILVCAVRGAALRHRSDRPGVRAGDAASGSSSSACSDCVASSSIPGCWRRSIRATRSASWCTPAGTGLLVLGGVFLCITGGEALYADMGHFGKRADPPFLVFHRAARAAAELCGPDGLLLDKGAVTGNPFFLMAPAWSIYPMVLLATVATIIASQAIITGSFSMTRQAMQLGWLPGVAIRQTSDRGLRSDLRARGQLADDGGDGVDHHRLRQLRPAGGRLRYRGGHHDAADDRAALSGDGGIWRWPRSLAVLTGGLFFIVDLAFFSANLLKIEDGGWLPLASPRSSSW